MQLKIRELMLMVLYFNDKWFSFREKEYEVTTSASQLNPEFFSIVKKAKTLSTREGRVTVTDSDTE